jgi:hypothetical protein
VGHRLLTTFRLSRRPPPSRGWPGRR